MSRAILSIAVLFFLPVCASTTANSNSTVQCGIEYYTQTNKSVYELGEEIEMLFRVTNLTDEDVLIGCSRAGEFNLLVEKNDEPVWALAEWFFWYSPGIELSAGESIDVSHIWDMIDANDYLITPGIYDVFGVMYNEPWNYDNQGIYVPTEVSVPITVIPEPSSFFLLTLGAVMLRRKY